MTDRLAQAAFMIKKVAQKKVESPPSLPADTTPPALILEDGEHDWNEGVLHDSPDVPCPETRFLVEWCQPQWSDQPLLKVDCPEMGYLSYQASPPPHL